MEKIESGKLRGTRLLLGSEAAEQRAAESAFRSCLHRPWI